MANSVLKDWVQELTLQLQGTLLGAIRGPDGVHKYGPAKPLVRTFRSVVMHNAKTLTPENTYAGDGSDRATEEEVAIFIDAFEQYPLHWVMYFLYGAAIVGYCIRTPPQGITGLISILRAERSFT